MNGLEQSAALTPWRIDGKFNWIFRLCNHIQAANELDACVRTRATCLAQAQNKIFPSRNQFNFFDLIHFSFSHHMHPAPSSPSISFFFLSLSIHPNRKLITNDNTRAGATFLNIQISTTYEKWQKCVGIRYPWSAHGVGGIASTNINYK